jgi:hypothetical protein
MTIPQPVGRPELTILLRIISIFGTNWDAHYPLANTAFVLARTPAHAAGLANGSFELKRVPIMLNVAVKADLVSSIFALLQIEADMPRTKAALSDALRIGAEELTSQITNGTIAPMVQAAPTTKGPKNSGNGKQPSVPKRQDRDAKLQELAAELAPAKGKRRSSAQVKKMKQVVVRELKNGTPANRLASLFNTTVGNINQMRYR